MKAKKIFVKRAKEIVKKVKKPPRAINCHNERK